MAFDKSAREAGDIAKEGRGCPIAEVKGQTLQLNSFVEKESGSFGKITIMDCVDEDGDVLRVSTFSMVVNSQCYELSGHLPCIIHPQQVGNYFVIF